MIVLLVGIGAAIGAPTRYLTDRAVQRRHATGLRWGTFAVNAQYVGPYNSSFPNTPGNPNLPLSTFGRTDGYVNTNVTFGVKRRAFSAQLYVENLFDDHSVGRCTAVGMQLVADGYGEDASHGIVGGVERGATHVDLVGVEWLVDGRR